MAAGATDVAAYGAVPRFDLILTSKLPKDTRVTITEETAPGSAGDGAEPSAKRSRTAQQAAAAAPQAVVDAHSLVLSSLSSFFMTKLEDWSDHKDQHHKQKQKQQLQYEVQVYVPAGQLDLGQRLITGMYATRQDLSDLQPQQLVQLAALAESYDVPKVLMAAAEALCRLPASTVTLQFASALYELPDSCLQRDCFKPALDPANQLLQQVLGDLEVTWGDADKQQQLLALSFGALRQLLSDSRTRVASEDTVCYTIRRWLQQHAEATDEQQGAELASLVRLPQCTGTYMWSVLLKEDGWLRAAVMTDRDLLAASCMRGLPGDLAQLWVEDLGQGRPAWQLPARPASRLFTSLKLTWDLPIIQLQRAYGDLSASGVVRIEGPAPVAWHGRVWELACELTATKLTFFVCGDHACFHCELAAKGAGAGGIRKPNRATLLEPEPPQGRDLVSCPDAKGWQDVLAQLQRKYLIHADGCLHMVVTVSQVK